MRKIEKDSDKMITFSKRRGGIYKKASELVTLTGCEIGFLVFSPAGKAFSFANSSFDDLVKRFMERRQLEPSLMPYNMEGLRQAKIDQLTERYNKILEVFDTDKKKEVILKGLVAGKPMNNWWNRSIDDMAPKEIQGLEIAFMEVFNRVEQRKLQILNMDDNNEFVYDNNNYYDNNNNNVMNMDDVAAGSVFAPFGMQPPTVEMRQTNVEMSMGPTLMPDFQMVGPSDDVGPFAVDSFSMVGPSGGGNGVLDS
ncbi:Agamous-like MADS-box protein AGL61 [Linum perenne]